MIGTRIQFPIAGEDGHWDPGWAWALRVALAASETIMISGTPGGLL